MAYAYGALAATAAAATTPTDWPSGWTFPLIPWTDEPYPPTWDQTRIAWPPAWPVAPSGETLSVSVPASVSATTGYINVEATLLLNGVDDSTLNLHLIGVVCGIGSTQVNIRASASDPWSQVLWFQVGNYSGTKYGFSNFLYADIDVGDIGSTLTFQCALISVYPAITGSDSASVVAGSVPVQLSCTVSGESLLFNPRLGLQVSFNTSPNATTGDGRVKLISYTIT